MRPLTIVLALLMLFSCVNYRQIQYQPSDLFGNKRVQKNIENYQVIVHSQGEVATLENAEIGGNELKGRLTYVERSEVNDSPIGKEELKKRRNELHVYLDGKEEFEFPSEKNESKRVIVPNSRVDYVKAVSTNEKQIISTMVLVLGFAAIVIALIALGILLVVGITVAIFAGSSQASDGSNSNSNSSKKDDGGSTSTGGGGGSNSGNSGGSNSGGGSGSGCYIATMAYGDYDDPQVLKLRVFRDNYLLKRQWGQKFVQWYYKNSPQFVDRTKGVKWLHVAIRFILNQGIRILQWRNIV